MTLPQDRIEMTITQIGFRNRSFIPAMTAVLAIFACTYDTAVAAESEAEFWLRYAESACNEIKNENAADRAFNRLHAINIQWGDVANACLLYTSPSPRDQRGSRMPSSA